MKACLEGKEEEEEREKRRNDLIYSGTSPILTPVGQKKVSTVLISGDRLHTRTVFSKHNKLGVVISHLSPEYLQLAGPGRTFEALTLSSFSEDRQRANTLSPARVGEQT